MSEDFTAYALIIAVLWLAAGAIHLKTLLYTPHENDDLRDLLGGYAMMGTTGLLIDRLLVLIGVFSP